MSSESAAAFYDRLQSDISLQEELKTRGTGVRLKRMFGTNSGTTSQRKRCRR